MAAHATSFPVTRRPSGIVLSALALIGFSATVAQIVLLRELMVVFCGNELSTGIMLAAWLFWTAFGSSVLGRLSARARQPQRLIAILELSLAVALPATVFAVRASRLFFHALPGEVLGPSVVLLTSAAALSVFCALSGCLFTAGARWYSSLSKLAAAPASSNVYLLEAIGSAAGGLLVSLVLVSRVGAFQIALFIAAINGLAAVLLFTRVGMRRWISMGLLAIAAVSFSPRAAAWLERASLARLWHGTEILQSRDSRFGKLTVVQNEGSWTLYENGLPVFTVPDPAAAEEAVHYALLQHRAPTRLLLIGGGLNGSIREAFKHPSLQEVDYVELDPEIFRLAGDYFRPEWQALIADRRVHVITGDGRRFLRKADRRWDVIIVNLPEPLTAQLNRFYTREFFSDVKAKLNPNGILSFQVHNSENYISPQRAEFLGCIYRSLREVFPAVGFIPGETVHFFAGERDVMPDSTQLIATLHERHIQTSYVGEAFLPFRMMPDRMAEMREVLASKAADGINRDFTPAAYYFDVALWSTQFNQGYRRVFELLAKVRFLTLLLALVAAEAIAAALVSRHPPRARQTTASLCAVTVGFGLMGMEVLLLLGFQAIYGYVYQQLALLVAAFMAGIATGSWWALRKSFGMRALAVLQILAVGAPLLLYTVLLSLTHGSMGWRLERDYLGETVFVILAVAAGAIGGLQFPAASRVFMGDDVQLAGAQPLAGTLYALDLIGACAGAIVISTYLVPVFGFARTATVMAVAAAGPAFLALALALPARAVRN